MDTDGNVRLADFGIYSRIETISKNFPLRPRDSGRKTPESVFPKEFPDVRTPTKASDIFSFATLVWSVRNTHFSTD